MKSIIIFAALIGILVFASCKKEIESAVVPNTPPVFVNTCVAKEYNVDIKVKDTFTFIENYTDPWGYDFIPEYHDYTILAGNGIIQPFGDLVWLTECDDIGPLNYHKIFTDIRIYSGGNQVLYLKGNCTINFKKVKTEGGAFDGTFTTTSGATKYCHNKLVTSLPPLTITGDLDTTTHIFNLTIKGKVNF